MIFWYKRISVFRNIKEEPPHIAYLNSCRNCTFRCHWLCSKENLLLNPCSMLPAHSMLTMSPFLNRHFISLFWGSSSLCILRTSGKNAMKCWVLNSVETNLFFERIRISNLIRNPENFRIRIRILFVVRKFSNPNPNLKKYCNYSNNRIIIEHLFIIIN